MKHTKKAIAEPAAPQKARGAAQSEVAIPRRRVGTERWPAQCVQDGEWIQLPKVILKRFPKLGVSPQHLLLLLVLQSDRYRDRPVRFFWEELAELCGCNKNTVRRWGYELKRKGLLTITPIRKPLPGEERVIGFRNARSIFDLRQFELKVGDAQTTWAKEREERKRGSRKQKP